MFFTSFFNSVHFSRPLWFLAVPVCLLIIFLMWGRLKNENNWQQWISAPLLKIITLNEHVKKSHAFALTTITLIWLITSIALTGPSWYKTEIPVEKNTSAIVLVVDQSPSMKTQDLPPNRTIRIQRKLIDLFSGRVDGVSGIVSYATNAHTVAPLTEDTQTLNYLAQAISPDIMPSTGKDAFQGVQHAVNLLEQNGNKTGDIILLTDTVDSTKSDEITRLINQTHYHLHVLGVGTPEGAPAVNAEGALIRDNTGKIIIYRLTRENLQHLASENRGIYHDLTINDDDIEAILQQVNKNYSTETVNRNVSTWKDEGVWLTLLLLPFSLLAFRRGWVCIILLTIGFSKSNPVYANFWKDLWYTKDQQAQKLLSLGENKKAAETFQNPAWKAEALYRNENYEQATKLFGDLNTAQGFYNQGNTLARSGKFEEAIDSYKRALSMDQALEDAKTNLSLVEEALKKQQQSSTTSDKNDSQQDGDENRSNNNTKNQSETNNTQQSQDDPQQTNANNSSEQASSNANDGKSMSKKDEDKTENSEEKSSNLRENKAISDQNNKQAEQLQQENNENDKTETTNDNASLESYASKSVEDENDDLSKLNSQDIEAKNIEKLSNQELENWLRHIPSDPGALLKKKFLLEKRDMQQQEFPKW